MARLDPNVYAAAGEETDQSEKRVLETMKLLKTGILITWDEAEDLYFAGENSEIFWDISQVLEDQK